MKKILLLSLAILIAIVSQSKTIEKTFFFNNFNVIQQGSYSIIQAEGALNTAITGQPLLPWYAAKFLLPPGEVIESVEYIGQDMTTIPGSYQLMPKQYSQPVSKGKSGVFAKDEIIYNSNSLYPIDNISNKETSFWAGHSIGMVNYTPLMYEAKNGLISYYRQITIIVKTKKSDEANNALQLSSSNKKIIPQISSYVENPEMLKEYSQVDSKNDDYQMLIITPEQFIADFDTLIGHYRVRGLKAIAKSKEEILAEMDGQDAQEKIRNYIIQEFTSHGAYYIMLGGDVEHIPYRGFYCVVQSSTVYEDDNIPSDLYYSALDGNWNTDADNKWGEIGEDDLLPEVAVARFSFSNSSELASMLNKTISYQSTPVTGNLAHPMMAGEHLWDDPLTYGSHYIELMIGYHDDNGYETTGIPETNTFTKLYDAVSSWGASDLINEINLGKSFIHHCGHANENTVMKLYTSDITNNNFSGANGIDQQFTNVYTHGCICGSFDASDCIAETMVKIDNFAASFVGNSRYGWFNEGQTEGPSGHIHREFIDALYTDSLHRIGATHMESKYATAPWVNAAGQHEEGALRWCFYDCNVLGDPAMSIWTAEPWNIQVNYPNAITVGDINYEITISSNGNPVEGLDATLVFENEIHGTNISNQNGEVNISLDPVFTVPGIAKLYVSGFNCIPQEFDVQIVPAEGAYIVIHECTINDASGNNNQLLDYNETASLNISLENVGAAIAESVIANLSCDHPDVTINTNQADFGNIEGESIITLNDAFNITISDDIEDMNELVFTVNAVSSGTEWESQFSLIAHAPELIITGMILNDDAGDNNGRLDPGETAILSFNLINEGSSLSPVIIAQLSSSTSFINISSPTQNMTALEMDETTSVGYEVSVDANAEIGDIAHFLMSFTADNYQTSLSYFLPIGLQVEDWESATFNEYEWTSDGDAPWTIIDQDIYEGDYCSKSGNIGDNQNSIMGLEVNILNTDSISFYYKVSSEGSYDFLKFYIDENKQDEWSGEIGWTRAVYAVNAGEHSFSWEYSKDVNSAGGSDMACVDYIVFPALGLISKTDEIANRAQLKMFPNPVSHQAHISFVNEKEQNIEIQILDQNGKVIQEINKGRINSGSQELSVDLSNLNSGSYSIILKTGNIISSISFIKI